MGSYQYEYGSFVLSFARRTKANLLFIERQLPLRKLDEQNNDNFIDGDNPPYEVTQLINSMLGLLVFIKEEFYDFLPVFTINLYAQVTPDHYKTDSRYVIRRLRNAIGHARIELKSLNGEIRSVRFRDESHNNVNDWCEVYFSDIGDLRRFLYDFLDAVEESIKGKAKSE